jgi:nitroimidazol reductase NimA-like FMN-containing flavoprotein (pyridoxamine 5'-phosphate oxidase superfamily)
MEYIPYTGLRNLRRLDLYSASFVLVSLPIFPTIWSDRVFTAGLLFVDSFVLLSTIGSVLLLRRAPWLPPDIYDLVYASKFAHVGTSDANMTPHVVPTSYVFDGMDLFFMSSVVSKKLKNIKANDRVAFIIDVRDSKNLLNNKAVLFTGKAKIMGLFDVLSHPLKVYTARRLFMGKYPEYARKYAAEKKNLPKAWQLTPMISRVLVDVQPENIVYWRKADPIILPM